MTRDRFDLRELDDRQLLDGLLKLHQTSAEVMADLLCHLAEVERRRLHLREATRSVFKYAVEILGCTEDEAWRRVAAAQTAARFPVIFDKVSRGELTLTAVNMLRGVLTEANHSEVLCEAAHKTKAQLEIMVARLAPKADVPTRLARVAERARPAGHVRAPDVPLLAPPGGDALALALRAPAAETLAASPAGSLSQAELAHAATSPARPEPARVAPLSPERWRLSLTIGGEAERALRTARDLTPDGDLARIVERAVIEYAEKLEGRKLAKLKGRKRRLTGETIPRVAPVGLEPSQDTSAAPGTLDGARAPTSAEAAAMPVVSSSAPGRTGGPKPPRGCDATVSGSHRPATPRALVRAVVERDGGRCGYVSPDTGRRCSETANLEIHHLVAVARGGATTADQLSLRCKAHHAHQTALDFGADHVAQAIARRRRRDDARRDRGHPAPGSP